MRYRLSRGSFAKSARDLDCRAITYESDGLVIDGWLMAPRGAKGGELPVPVYNRGGNGSYSAISAASLMHNVAPYAHEGFLVVASQYRGAADQASDSPAADQFGGSDVRDVTRLVELASQIPEADTTQVFMLIASSSWTTPPGLVIHPGDDHHLTRNRSQAVREVVRWFRAAASPELPRGESFELAEPDADSRTLSTPAEFLQSPWTLERASQEAEIATLLSPASLEAWRPTASTSQLTAIGDEPASRLATECPKGRLAGPGQFIPLEAARRLTPRTL